MNVLVIGGAGYIGSNFAELLINEGHNVIVLDDLSTGFKEGVHPKAKFILGSQHDLELLKKIMKENKIDVVAHFAAKLIVPESVAEPASYFFHNVGGVATILEAMRSTGVRNIIFSSTAAVYGFPKKIPVDEQSEKNPCNPYGESKLACEWLIKDAKTAYDINYTILRYFNVAGASQSGLYGLRKMQPTLLIPVINRSLIEGFTMQVFGDDYENTKDGSCVRDYIHVGDLARAHSLAMDWMTKNNTSGIFNLGTNSGYSVLEVIKRATAVTGKEVKYEIKPRRAGDPDRLLTLNKHANDVLKWKPELSLDDMILSDYTFRTKLYK